MTPHQRMLETARRTKRSLFIVTGLFVAIGLVVAAGAAIAGDRLSAFLGFLVVSGALTAAVVLNTVLSIGLRVSAIGESIDDIRAGLEQLDASGVVNENRNAAGLDPNVASTLDLAAVGPVDASELTAATLERIVFPRLANATTGDSPSATDEFPLEELGGGLISEADRSPAMAQVEPVCQPASTGVASKNPWRVWRVALRDGDLATCRSVFPTLVDTADRATVGALTADLQMLSDRMEEALRATFAERIREKDYAGALAVGDKIRTLFADRPVAAEFERIQPLLLRRVNDEPETPSSSVVATR